MREIVPLAEVARETDVSEDGSLIKATANDELFRNPPWEKTRRWDQRRLPSLFPILAAFDLMRIPHCDRHATMRGGCGFCDQRTVLLFAAVNSVALRMTNDSVGPGKAPRCSDRWWHLQCLEGGKKKKRKQAKS